MKGAPIGRPVKGDLFGGRFPQSRHLPYVTSGLQFVERRSICAPPNSGKDSGAARAVLIVATACETHAAPPRRWRPDPPRQSLVAATLVLIVFASAFAVLADGRVALAVGNGSYIHSGRLPIPENDAVDEAAALRRLGFDVTSELDADPVALTEALQAFPRRSVGADVSLVFYAGHGIETDGMDYVMPVDARLERDVDVRYETVTLGDLLVSTAGASLRLVLLDACWNNPLARSMQSAIRGERGRAHVTGRFMALLSEYGAPWARAHRCPKDWDLPAVTSILVVYRRRPL